MTSSEMLAAVQRVGLDAFRRALEDDDAHIEDAVRFGILCAIVEYQDLILGNVPAVDSESPRI